MNPLQSEYLHNIVDVLSMAGKDMGSLHPVVVHFPIALLFIAPLFIVLGLIFQRSRKPFYICAVILMILGTASLYLSLKTGDIAAENLETTPAIVHTLEEHVEYAEHARTSFLILTLLFLAYVAFYGKFFEGLHTRVRISVLCLYLLIFVSQLVILFNAAHYGGKLVHHHSITSSLFSESK